MKKTYQTPQLLNRYSLETESSLLAGSVITNTSTVETTGQEVTEYDGNSSDFYHDWTD